VAYVLLDLRRRKLGIRSLVTVLENAVVNLLGQYGLPANSDPAAPGVYVKGSKLASVGLRVRRGCSYHGLSLNVNTDLSAFSLINPCGFKGLKMTSLYQHGVATYPAQVAIPLASEIIKCLREAAD
jgi:lipoyl(octanoyl) transferase